MSGARPWLRSESMRSLSARVAERDHPALAGGQLLVGVEAEHRRVPAPADRAAVGVARAERLAGVLDDRQARSALERGHVGRVAEDVHRQQRRRALGHRRRGGLRVEVQRHRVDVGEHRPRALVQHGVGRGDERERARDDLVAVAHADRAQRQVQPGGAAGDRAGVRRAERARRSAARTPHARPERELARAQHLEHRALLLLARAPAGRAGSPRRLTRPRAIAPRVPAAARLHPVLQRVHERVPGGRDQVLRDADRAPHVVAVGGVDAARA